MTNLPRLLAIYLAVAAPAIAQDSYDHWSDVAAIPFPAGQQGSGGMVSPDGDSLIVFGGDMKTARLKISTNTWTLGPADGVPAATPPLAAGTTYDCWAVAQVPGSSTVYAIFRDDLATGSALHSVDLATGTWSAPLARLPIKPGTGLAMTASATQIFVLGGQYSPGRTGTHVYTIATNTWAASSNLPMQANEGASIVFHGGTALYAIGGNDGRYLCRGAFTAPSTIAWTTLALPNNMPTQFGSSLMSDTANNRLYLCSGNEGNTDPAQVSVYQVQSLLFRFDVNPQLPAGGIWYELDRTPGSMDLVSPSVRNGSTLCQPAGSSTIYLMRGHGTQDLYHFDTVSSRFKDLAPIPVQPFLGFRAVGANGLIYAMTGPSNRFFCYSPESGEWTEKAPLPDLNSQSSALAWDGGDHLYAACGYGFTFCRYSISGANPFGQIGDSWVSSDGGPLAPINAQNPSGQGCQFVRAGPYLFALLANPTNPAANFRRFAMLPTNPQNQIVNTWQVAARLPDEDSFSAGSGAAWPGSGNVIYVMPGGGSPFLAYDFAANKWSDGTAGAPAKPADLPAGYTAGNGSMCYPGRGRQIFMTGAGPTGSAMLTYTLPGGPDGDTWTLLASPPGSLQWASSLCYPGNGRYLYAFPGFRSNTIWRYWKWSAAPAAPTELAQFRRDGTTPIAFGGYTGHDEVVVTATGSDAENDPVQLEVEIKPVGTPFANAGTRTALAPSGQAARMTLGSLLPGTQYLWQVRAVDDHGVPSPWVRGGPAPGYSVLARANTAPGIDGLSQAGGAGPLPIGSLLAGTLHLGATSQDPDAGDLSVVEIECRHVTERFTGLPTQISAPGANPSAVFEIAIEGEGGFRWRGRGRDEWGVAGPWVSFGGNGDAEADFLVNAIGSLGDAKLCSSGAVGSPLLAVGLLVLLIARRR